MKTAVIGLGLTGTSAIHYLQKKGDEVIAFDTRLNPAGIERLQQLYPGMEMHLGDLSPLLQANVDRMLVSPGLSLQDPILQKMAQQDIPFVSDIDLFLENNTAKLIAITGSNGKTTVTSWVGQCLRHLGYRVNICGNIGTPVLSTLESGEYDFLVMELSSFQLDLCQPIRADVAVCLNVSPDHLDRHGTVDNYRAAKMKIFQGAKKVVVNADSDAGFVYSADSAQQLFQFALHQDATVRYVEDKKALQWEDGFLFSVSNLNDNNNITLVNAAAVLTTLTALGVDREKACEAIACCKGLKHRFQWVAEKKGVNYINDSKATNVGAAIVSMQTAAQQAERVIVIAGGETKASPLQEWAGAVAQCGEKIIIYGADAGLMATALSEFGVKPLRVNILAEAVALAEQQAQAGDIVLLAPAATSWDQFKSYEERGDLFMKLVLEE